MMFRCFGTSGVILLLGAAGVLGCSDDGDTADVPSGGTSASGGAAGSANSSLGGNAGSSQGGSGGSSMAAAAGSSGAGVVANEDVSFATDIWPILTANCSGAGCHGDGSFLPKHASADVNTAYDEAAAVADLIIGRVSGTLTPIMPQFCGPAPGTGECLSLEEVALIRAWVDQGAAP